MDGNDTIDVTRPDRGGAPRVREPGAIPLMPGYLQLIRRVESLPSNATGADKDWVHRAHAEALRHLDSAQRRR